MNKKITTLSLLSVCISLAIHSSAQAEPLLPVAAEATEISCPADMNQLSEDEKRALPEVCQGSVDNPWISEEEMYITAGVVGAGALVAIAAAAGGSSGGSGKSSGGNSGGDSDGGDDDDKYQDWDIGNVIEGDGQDNAIDGDTAAGNGQIGNLVTGNNTNNTISGNTDVAEGGKGTVVDGNNTSTTNNGDTSVSGEGSVGLEVNGNDAQVNVNGGTEVSDGGTGIAVNGDNSDVTLNGDMRVTQGATGVRVEGNTASVSNSGNIIVSDAGSVGVNLVSDDAAFVNRGNIEVTDKGQGVVLNGQRFDVLLDGSVTVDAGEARNEATGVAINGSEGLLTIAGDVNVRDVLMKTPDEWEKWPRLTGVSVKGHDNQVRIDGALNLDYLGVVESAAGQGVPFRGLEVSGNGNTVSLLGGINLSYQVESSGYGELNNHNNMSGIYVGGNDNTLLISGESTYYLNTGDAALNGYKELIRVSGQGNVVQLDKDFLLSVSAFMGGNSSRSNINVNVMSLSGQGLIQNNGEIDIGSVASVSVIGVADGGMALNHGRISYQGEGIAEVSRSLMTASGTGSQVINAESGLLTLQKSSLPKHYGIGSSNNLPFGYGGGQTYSGLYAVSGGQAFNQGTIEVSGAGTFGMAGYGSVYLDNSGTIRMDVLQQLTDENGEFTGEQAAWEQEVARFQMRGSGMYIELGGLAINRGEIEVTNSGVGMFADNAAVVNQGTISLEADHAEAGMLYAMAARENGVAINDTDGVININTDKGLAFYTEGNGRIINRGSVNYNGTGIDNGHGNWGAVDEPFDGDFVFNSAIISQEGGVQTITPGGMEGIWYLSPNVGNYGTAHVAGSLRANGWLQNTGHLSADGDITSANINNTGSLSAAGTLNGVLINHGDVSVGQIATDGLYNAGSVTTDVINVDGGTLVNYESGLLMVGNIDSGPADNRIINQGEIVAVQDGTAGITNGAGFIYNEAGATIRNTGTAMAEKGKENSLIHVLYHAHRRNHIINRGDLIAINGYSAISTEKGTTSDRWVYNLEGGRIYGENPLLPLINLTQPYSFYNEGEVTVKGDSAIAIQSNDSSSSREGTSWIVNAGVINVGTEEGKLNGTNGTGLVGIHALGRNTAVNNMQDGVINIWADDSWAFARSDERAQIINNGTVNLLCDTGCDIFKAGATASDGEDFTGIPMPGATPEPSLPTAPDLPSANTTLLSGYVVGTNSDGTAGTLSARDLAFDTSVTVDTGFTVGTAAKSITFESVFKADSIRGEENIGSESVVWNASANKNADGNIDVTMTKNGYAALVTDSQVNHLADALDKGYTNNSLFNSLNVSSVSALNTALKQLSGVQAKSLNREARVLGQRFTMLADTAAVTTDSGLSFNVVAKGDPRAEMANKVTYDMMSLGQRFDTAYGEVTARYGMARLSGSGGNHRERAGDNGLTGGYSQFFGLSHRLPLRDNNVWENSLRWDLHQLDSRRHLSFEGVNEVANASGRQQQLSFRSEGVKTFTSESGWTMSPFAGMKLRHHQTDGYQEHGAGDFNLSVNRYSETAVDAVAGLRLNYAGKDGWGAQAVLEAGPNLSFSQSQRTASLQGLQGQSFRVEDGKKGGGINGQAMLGANYQKDNLSFDMNAYQWQEDGAADKGFRLNVTHRF